MFLQHQEFWSEHGCNDPLKHVMDLVTNKVLRKVMSQGHHIYCGHIVVLLFGHIRWQRHYDYLCNMYHFLNFLQA